MTTIKAISILDNDGKRVFSKVSLREFIQTRSSPFIIIISCGCGFSLVPRVPIVQSWMW